MPDQPHFTPTLPLRLGGLLVAAIFFAALNAAPVNAQASSLSPRAHQALSEAQISLQNSKWTEADASLRRLIENFSREPVALATAWQMRGYLLSQSGKDAEALQAYEKALEFGSLDAGNTQQVRYNIAQILMSLGKHDEAGKRIDAWLAHSEAVTAEQRVQVAWIHLGARNYSVAAGHLEQAIRATAVPPESWYQLLVAALQGAENFPALKEWLPIVIERFPGDKRYWQQLSSAYFQMKDDRRAVATLMAAYHNGLLTERGDILHLARFTLYAGVPHKAARVLQDALEKELIDATAEHLELLADSWLRAQEIPAAVKTLEKALQANAGPETSLKLGQLHLRQEEWSAARPHLQRAAQSTQERTRGEALLLLGMAAYYSGDAEAARDAFVQARSHSAARRQADSWLTFLGSGAIPPGT